MISFDDFVDMHQLLDDWLSRPENKSLALTREQVITLFDIINDSLDYDSFDDRLSMGDYPLLTGGN